MTINEACMMANATHPAIGVLCRNGNPMFYVTLTDPTVGTFTVEHDSDPAELAAYLPKPTKA
jgi:hypothetical protein